MRPGHAGIRAPVFRRSHGILTLAAALAWNCGSDAPSGPERIASVRVTPGRSTIDVGATEQFTATLHDARGNVLPAGTIGWSSANEAVASVDPSGVVTGEAPGATTITATADGKEDAASVTVQLGAVVLNAISPDPMVEWQTATLTGRGFSLVPAENSVTVDGMDATVLSATTTSLTIDVPRAICLPARNVAVQVEVSGRGSAVLQHAVRPETFVELPVGQQLILSNPRQFCLQFGGGGTQTYLIGVQSTADDVSSLTPVTLTLESSSGLAGAADLIASPGSIPGVAADRRAAIQGGLPVEEELRAHWRRHYAAEAALRSHDRAFMARHAGAGARRSVARGAATMAASSIPAGLQPGSIVGVRVPDWADQCHTFTSISAVVRIVGARAIWLEDVGNPAGGVSPADLQTLANQFDGDIYDTGVQYFGAPTDIDGNGQVAIVVTKEVNRLSASLDSLFDLSGFMKPANFLTPAVCPSTNEGEIIYLRTPDPAGAFGRQVLADDFMTYIPRLLSHEFAHVMQLGRAILAPGGLLDTRPNWQLEGQAVLAEEVVGHRVTGRTTMQNYGFAVAANRPRAAAVDWYTSGYRGLAFYFGFSTRTSRVQSAPEECSWLAMTREGNDSPCASIDLGVYGTGWSFLRWISDHFGPRFPGGEPALHRALVEGQLAGFEAIENLVRVPRDSLLAQWAAALYVDDRLSGAAVRLTLPSWNLLDISNGLVETARLQPKERLFSSYEDEFRVRGGSTAYFRVGGPGRPASIGVHGPENFALPAHMRLWVVRLQ